MTPPNQAMWLASVSSALPPRYSATAIAEKAGVPVDEYRGWPYFHRATEHEHPSTMGAQALRKALAKAQLGPRDLSFILFTGMSRDFVPSWSVATEIAKLCDAQCFGLDLTIGCLGMTLGLETAAGLFATDGERTHGAVVCAERWAYTVDRSDGARDAMWAHSDGSAAIIVSRSPGKAPVAQYDGVSLKSLPEMNGFVTIPYGGTRNPVAPEGEEPFKRVLRGDPKSSLFPKYMQAFQEVIENRIGRASAPLERAICNQISPNVVAYLESNLSMVNATIPRTGLEHGHVGGCDSVLGLEQVLANEERLQHPTLLLSSSPYAFAAASLLPGG